MKLTKLAQWNEIYDRFDPTQEGNRPEWNADRPNSPAQKIINPLRRPRGIPRFLLLGTTGTGKTTELLRVAQACSDKDFVVFLNLSEHFKYTVGDENALQEVQSWEVCFLAGLALIKAAKHQLQYDFEEEGLIRPLAEAWYQLAIATGLLNSGDTKQINLASLAKSMTIFVTEMIPGVAPAGRLIQAVSEATTWEIPIGKSKKKLYDQDPPVIALLESVNKLIGKIQSKYRRVLLIIDGLDRIRDISIAENLFRHSQLIGSLLCPLVVCGPFSLRHDTAASEIHTFEIQTLFNEPVLLQSDPTKFGPGIEFFCEVYRRRVADIGAEEIIPRHHLERLAYYSGGRIREFIRFIRELANEVYEDPIPEQSTDEMIDEVLKTARRAKEIGITKEHIEILQVVMRDPAHRHPGGDLAWKLLNDSRLFPYPNESEWFYPHPLLTLHILR